MLSRESRGGGGPFFFSIQSIPQIELVENKGIFYFDFSEYNIAGLSSTGVGGGLQILSGIKLRAVRFCLPSGIYIKGEGMKVRGW